MGRSIRYCGHIRVTVLAPRIVCHKTDIVRRTNGHRSGSLMWWNLDCKDPVESGWQRWSVFPNEPHQHRFVRRPIDPVTLQWPGCFLAVKTPESSATCRTSRHQWRLTNSPRSAGKTRSLEFCQIPSLLILPKTRPLLARKVVCVFPARQSFTIARGKNRLSCFCYLYAGYLTLTDNRFSPRFNYIEDLRTRKTLAAGAWDIRRKFARVRHLRSIRRAR